ncbi:hypothetical protein BC629DRAFT_947146 [Irpex lacteus]|nr:hypothetical protein BC629DRAFT_947146 [Irpex lacteus]
MSETAKQLLNVDTPGAVSRSGRTRVPSMKLRESEPPNRTRVSPRKAPPSSASVSSLSAASAVAEDVRHTTPPPPAPDGSSAGSPSRVKVITPKSLAVAAQPRDSNGRFGKKAETNGRFMRTKHFGAGGRRLCKGPKTSYLTRRTAESYDEDKSDEGSDDEQREDGHPFDDALSELPSSDPMDGVEFGEEALEDVVNRRLSDSEHSDEHHNKRKRSISDDEESDNSPTTSPRFTLSRARGSLLRPNPISYARRKWAAHEDDEAMSAPVTVPNRLVIDDDDESVEDDQSEQEDNLLPVPGAAVAQDSGSDEEGSAQEDSEESSTASPPPARPLVPAARLARLTFGPSPMNLAKRRWAPLAQSSHLSESVTIDSMDAPYYDPPAPSGDPWAG